MVKALLLALALHGGADVGSLGIGMDVLPEAYSFAASRIGYAPHLALVGCDRRRCRWNLGAGVEMTASLASGTLSLDRIEIGLGESQASANAPGSSYGKACLAIVTLVAAKDSASEQRSIARSIAAGPAREIRLDMPDSGYSFYGSATAASDGIVARCGVAAGSVDVGSKL